MSDAPRSAATSPAPAEPPDTSGPAGQARDTARSPADQILAGLDDLATDFLVYVPCSTARPLLDSLTARLGARALVASVESESVAIGTGLALAGRRPLLMMQDTGLGNALTVLTTLPKAYHVPLLILATRTGGLREINAVVHEFADGVPALLDACRVPRFELDYRVPLAAWRGVLAEAGRASQLSRRPTVVLADLKAGHPEAAPAMTASSGSTPVSGQPASGVAAAASVTDAAAPAAPAPARLPSGPVKRAWLPPALGHLDALAAIAAAFSDDPLVSSCGVASRELASLGLRDTHLYLLNSMGAVGPTGLGLALGLSGRLVAAVEGDGGFLMGLGALATVAAVRPPGLVWIVVDNGVHCSTGGQPTAAQVVDLGALAAAAGLPVLRAAALAELRTALDEARRLAADGPVFLHVRTTPEAVPTPYFQPDAAVLADRFRRAIQ